MAISTISTLQKSLNARQLMAKQDREMQKAHQELVTGLKQDIYADRGFRAAQTLDLRNRMTRVESYAVSNDLLGGKLKIVSDLMSQMRRGVEEFQALSLTFGENAQGRDVLMPQAKALLATLGSQLNTVFAGEYLFSGTAVGTPSLTLGETGFALPQLDVAGNAAQTQATLDQIDAFFGLNGNPLAGSGFVQDGHFTGDTQLQGARLDETTKINYGLTAADEAMRQVLKGVSMYAALDVGTIQDPASYKMWLQEAGSALTKGIAAMQQRETELGNQQQVVSTLSDRQKTMKGLYNSRIVDIEGVDSYEAALRFEALSAQLETSLEVTARLRGLSLLNYL